MLASSGPSSFFLSLYLHLFLSPSSSEQSPGTRLGNTSPDCPPRGATRGWSGRGWPWASAPSPSPQGLSPPVALEAGVCAKCTAHSLWWALRLEATWWCLPRPQHVFPGCCRAGRGGGREMLGTQRKEVGRKQEGPRVGQGSEGGRDGGGGDPLPPVTAG